MNDWTNRAPTGLEYHSPNSTKPLLGVSHGENGDFKDQYNPAAGTSVPVKSHGTGFATHHNALFGHAAPISSQMGGGFPTHVPQLAGQKRPFNADETSATKAPKAAKRPKKARNALVQPAQVC